MIKCYQSVGRTLWCRNILFLNCIILFIKMNFEIPKFGRCCFCFPLRRGVVTFGYINALWSAIMIFMVGHFNPWFLGYFGYADSHLLDWDIQIGLYFCDIIFNILLVFGAHLNKTILLKAFVYYIISSTSIVFILQVVEIFTDSRIFWELTFVAFILSAAFNMFIVIICWNLIRKIERETPTEGYQNPLQQFVEGEVKERSDNIDTNNTNSTKVEVPVELIA